LIENPYFKLSLLRVRGEEVHEARRRGGVGHDFDTWRSV